MSKPPRKKPLPSGTKPAAAPVARPRSRSWLGGLAVAVPVALIAAYPIPQRPEGVTAGSPGYRSAVDDILIPMGWLVVGDNADEVDAPLVKLSPEATRLPEVRDFQLGTPLRGDLARGDPSIWKFDGAGLIGLEANARTVPSPFRDSGWAGNIRFASARPIAGLLADNGARISFDLGHPGRSNIPGDRQVAVTRLSGTDLIGVNRKFVMTDGGGSGFAFATAEVVGDTLVVTPRVGSRIAVRTDGAGDEADHGPPGRPLLVPSGRHISFAFEGRTIMPGYRFEAGSSTLSSWRPFGARVRDAQMGSLGQSIEAAMIATSDADDGSRSISLDRDLHLGLQKQLEATAETVRRASGKEFPAAAMVMDSRSGEVLALASWGEGSRVAGRLSENNNFRTLPVGSTAKVPFAAAIASQHPALLTLEIVGSRGQPFDRLFGVILDRPVSEEAGAATIDFDRFIFDSSNKYAASLMVAGLFRDLDLGGGCPSEEFSLGNARRSTRPRFAPFVVVDGGRDGCGGQFVRFSGPPSSFFPGDGSGAYWPDRFSRIFAIAGLEQPLAKPRNRSVWGDWADHEGARALDIVSPANEQFLLAQTDSFVNDYIHLALGGGRSRWTTIKLGEAYSRLVTNRPVRASLRLVDTSQRRLGLAELDPGVRARILGAMELVVSEGTASMLDGPVRALDGNIPGERIRVFAKTGTPSIAVTRENRNAAALQKLVAARHIVISTDPDRLIDVVRPAGESRQAAFARLLREDPSLVPSDIGSADLAIELSRIRDRQRTRTQSVVRGNRIVLTGSEQTGGKAGNGKVFAMVIGRYCATETDLARPVDALTLVVNFQDKGVAKPALEMTAALLKPGSPFHDRLMRRTSSCPQGQLVRRRQDDV